ncbi:SDR family NAD(P)-dependent oxidoreductase [Blastococcus sp. SYSU D00820]
MELRGRQALVTGANRGIGAHFVEALLARGVAVVHAGARDPAALAGLVARHGPRVAPVRLDVTRPDDVAAAVAACPEVDLLVSNAGRSHPGPVLADAGDAALRELLEVNVLGPLSLVRGLAPQLRTRRGGVLTVLSLAALLTSRSAPLYSASKAAAMMVAQGVRAELAADGVTVTNVYPGYVDTDMTAGATVPKASPRSVAERSLDAWQAGRTSVFPDRLAELARDAVASGDPAVLDDPQGLSTRLGAALSAERAGGA